METEDRDRDRPEDRFFDELSRAHFITKGLVSAFARDAWPGDGVADAFGLDSVEHYQALHGPVRAMEVTPSQLDAAMGDGARLTELVRDAPANPHKGLEFRTWGDLLREHEGPSEGGPATPGLEIPEPEI